MTDIKMSDWFKLPITIYIGDMYSGGEGLFISDRCEISTEEAKATEYAINNHDRLVEDLETKSKALKTCQTELGEQDFKIQKLESEKLELLTMLSQFIPSNDYPELDEDGDEVYCNYGGEFQYGEESEYIGLEVVEMINKHKDLKNGKSQV